jgi:membrane protein
VRESRPFWKVWGIALLLVIGLSVLIVIGTVLLVFGPQLGGLIAERVGLDHAFTIGWNILRWPLSLFFLIFAIANIYYFAPDVEQEWKWITPGSISAIIVWILSSLGFSYYVSNFGSYNKIYGSIGTIIVLMTWMYLLGFVILVGGEMNSEIEHAATSGKDPGQRELPETVINGEGVNIHSQSISSSAHR